MQLRLSASVGLLVTLKHGPLGLVRPGIIQLTVRISCTTAPGNTSVHNSRLASLGSEHVSPRSSQSMSSPGVPAHPVVPDAKQVPLLRWIQSRAKSADPLVAPFALIHAPRG